jgi:hypothetical protein
MLKGFLFLFNLYDFDSTNKQYNLSHFNHNTYRNLKYQMFTHKNILLYSNYICNNGIHNMLNW